MNIKDGVQQVVSTLYQENGEVRPSQLIEAAKPKTSPAHNGFEWNNKKAGQEYRLMQARSWIRRVRVVVEDIPTQMVHVPVFKEHDNQVTETEGYYKPVTLLVRSKYELALEKTVGQVESAQAALEVLQRVAPVERKEKIKCADRGLEMAREALTA